MAGTAEPEGSSAAGARHPVAVCRDESSVLDVVAAWAADGLAAREAVVLVGTTAHNDAVRMRVASSRRGEDGDEAAPRLVAVDAGEMLADILVDGSPDAARFQERVHAAVAAARGGDASRPVRAWGEMVDVLCQRGAPAEAMALEDLWNGFLHGSAVRLLCTYRGDPWHASFYHGALRVYAHGHDRMLPLANQPALDLVLAQAVEGVCGANAAALEAVLLRRGVPGLDLPMPRSVELLAALHHYMPDVGRRVMARVEYRPAEPHPGRDAAGPPRISV